MQHSVCTLILKEQNMTRTLHPMVPKIGLSLAALVIVSSAFASPHHMAMKKHPMKKAAKVAAPTKAEIAAGKKEFYSVGCSNCHSVGGKGGRIKLDGVAGEKGHDAKWFTVQVLDPSAHHSRMPSFKGRVKGKDLTNLVAFLTTLKKK